MNILVLVKVISGELNPFDASALEYALRTGANVTVLSMCPPAAERTLLPLTRLGVSRVILLSDPCYAGSDTLATSRILAAAVRKLQPDLVFCGRQSIDGDTAQVGPEVAALCGMPVRTGVMHVQLQAQEIQYRTRTDAGTLLLPSLLTFEKGLPLRFPSIRSRMGTVEHWSNAELQLDPAQCGWSGSPTRVLQTYENTQGRRHCRRITYAQLPEVLRRAQAAMTGAEPLRPAEHPLNKVMAVGEAVLPHARALGRTVCTVPETDPETLVSQIQMMQPDAVLWNASPWGRCVAPQTAALLGVGLCADCTKLETDGTHLYMIRPAKGGNIMARIESHSQPQMATVRTVTAQSEWMVSAGKGIAAQVHALRDRVEALGGDFGASRGLVDDGGAPYETQVGLTGRTVAPVVYIAIGISGAVHHTCAIENAGTVVAINPDPDARIFDYADYGITEAYDPDRFFSAMESAFGGVTSCISPENMLQ